MSNRVPAAGLLCLLVLTAGCSARTDDGVPEASGTIEATQADLAFQGAGRLADLLPEEGARVTAGATLGHLDTSEVAARQRGAAAQLDAARALLAELSAGFRVQEVAQARLALDGAAHRLAEQARETARTVRLAEGGAVSQESRERAETALRLAQTERDRLAEQLALMEGGSRRERIAGQRALVAQAEAAMVLLEAVRAQMVLTAPFDGIVTVRHREPGEVVGPGAPVLSVLNPAERWVRVYLPQDMVGRISLGARVGIRSDAFPEQAFEGEVVQIATEAEFTPRNVQTREERVKLVHAVRIRILGDSALTLKPGLAADVRFEPPPA